MRKTIGYPALLIVLSFSMLSFGLKNTPISSKTLQQAVSNGYLVINCKVLEKIVYKKYIKTVNQLWIKFRGKLIIYPETSKPVVGNLGPDRTMVRFSTVAATEKYYNFSQYSDLKKLLSTSIECTVLLTQSNLVALKSKNQIKSYMIANCESKKRQHLKNT